MVSSLKTCGIEKMLYDLLQEIQKNRQKFANMGDELKRLITTFEKKENTDETSGQGINI